MKIKHWVLTVILLIGFALLWDYVDYNTEIIRLSSMYDIPESALRAIYPFVPFGDFTHPPLNDTLPK